MIHVFDSTGKQIEYSDVKTLKSDRFEELLHGTSYELLLSLCGNRRLLQPGKRVHQHIISSGHGDDRFLANLLVQMYGKCGSPDNARAVFDHIKEPNLFSWTLMLSAYANNARNREALLLFRQMDLQGERADRVTLITLLGVCSGLQDLRNGKSIHSRITALGFTHDPIAATAIFNMYAKLGCIRKARSLFERLPQKTIISWNSMITAYAQNGFRKRALQVFQRLDQEGIQPDRITYSAVLMAMAIKPDPQEAKRLHSRITACGFHTLVAVANPLMNLYCKCRCLVEARAVFEGTFGKDIVSWNTMITAYADEGHSSESLQLFGRMNVIPNWITFCAVFHACEHTGLVVEACEYLRLMRDRYGIEPRPEHHHCLVDILLKAGKLGEAEEVIHKVGLESEAGVWRRLLAAARDCGDVERGTRAAFLAMELEPGESAPLHVLANLYAAAGRLDDLDRLRRMMEGMRRMGNSRRSCGQMGVGSMPGLRKQTLRLERYQLRERMMKRVQELNRQMQELRGECVQIVFTN